MSTAPAPTGALSPRGTYPPTGPQTQPFYTIRRQPGRMPIGHVLGPLAVGVQLVFAVDALASGQISYGGCVSSDGCAATGAPSLTGAISVAVSPGGTTVYVAAFNGRAVAMFNRASAGQLTTAGCVSNDGSGGACADSRRATDRCQLLASTPRTPPTSSESLISLGHNRQQPTPTHASGGLDDIATQLPHCPAATGRARLSRRASPACQRSAPSPVGTSTTLGPHASRRPIPFAGAGDAARVHVSATYPTPGGVDPKELDDQVEEMYDRGLAPEEPRPAPPHAGALAEAPGYPPLCAHGMNSLTDRGYDLALGRVRRG